MLSSQRQLHKYIFILTAVRCYCYTYQTALAEDSDYRVGRIVQTLGDMRLGNDTAGNCEYIDYVALSKDASGAGELRKNTATLAVAVGNLSLYWMNV